MGKLEDCIQHVSLHVAKSPPTNEANTLLQVIDPILQALGYSPYGDISAEEVTAAQTRPDRVILPGSAQRWFLEAKAWTVPLNEPKFVAQALSYAHQLTGRWVVLTNGQTWRLYDDHMKDASHQDRLVWEACLTNQSSLADFLSALSKDRIAELPVAVRRQLLHKHLREELLLSASPIVKAMKTAICRSPGLSEVTTSEVSGFFESVLRGQQPSLIQAPEPEIPLTHAPLAPGGTPAVDPAPDGTATLAELAGGAVSPTGKHPSEVLFPDGESRQCKAWRELAAHCLQWCDRTNGPLPVPYGFARSKKGYFLNSSAMHKDGFPMRHGLKLQLTTGTAFCEVHLSAIAVLQAVSRVVQECGAQPASIRIRLN